MLIVASTEFVEEEQAGRSVKFVGWSFSFSLTFCFPAKQNCMIKFQRGSWRINQVFFSCWCSGWGYKWGSNSPYHCCVSALNIPQKSRAVPARVLLWQSQNNPTVSGQGDLPGHTIFSEFRFLWRKLQSLAVFWKEARRSLKFPCVLFLKKCAQFRSKRRFIVLLFLWMFKLNLFSGFHLLQRHTALDLDPLKRCVHWWNSYEVFS